MMVGKSKKMNTNYSPPWRGAGVGQYKSYSFFLNYGLYVQTLFTGHIAKNRNESPHVRCACALKWILITVLILDGRVLKAQNTRTYLSDSLLYAEGMMENKLQTGEWKY